jgi:hypothetical protein
MIYFMHAFYRHMIGPLDIHFHYIELYKYFPFLMRLWMELIWPSNTSRLFKDGAIQLLLHDLEQFT